MRELILARPIRRATGIALTAVKTRKKYVNRNRNDAWPFVETAMREQGDLLVARIHDVVVQHGLL